MSTRRWMICVSSLLMLTPAIGLADPLSADEPRGFYGRAGFAVVASPSYDFAQGFFNFFGAAPESTALYGFQVAGGYRWNRWVGTDAELIYAAGGEIRAAGVKVSSASAVAGSVVARFYPIELFRDAGPRNVEWALALGLGGGRFFEDTAISLSESTVLVRVGTGLDWWLGDRFGLYVDGAYFVATRQAINGFGFVAIGGTARF